MAINPRVRGVIIAGATLAVVAGIGLGVAVAKPASQSRYVTASAGTGDVTQTYTATGTITRTNTSEASFAVDGTVNSVSVAVGDEVEAGEVLAALKKGPLQLAVLDAETTVAEAKASLYAAQHPSSASNSSGSGANPGSSSAGSGSTGAGSSGSGSAGAARTVTIDPTALLAATAAVTTAVTDERTACQPVFGAVPDPQPTASTSPSASSSATPSASPSVTPSASPSVTPSASPSVTPSAGPTATETSPAMTPGATIKDQADTIESNDPTNAELRACGEARAEVTIATAKLQTLVRQLVQPSGSKPSGTGSAANSAVAKASGSSSTSTATVSAVQVAAAKAKLLTAQQQLQAAHDDLDDAELLAPISGTVGTVDLVKGNSAGAGSITLIGTGNARVSIELPLKTRTAITPGRPVAVTPAGSVKALTGKVTAISVVETSGTTGESPTYTTLVTVSDPDGLLAAGAKASATIPVAAATNVVRVPVSAVTPTGTGTATVSVLESGAAVARTVEVQTGAVGGGWVQITSGVTAGQTLVLADTTTELPTNTTNRRTTTGTRSSATASASTAAQPGGGRTTSAAAAPSASPSR